MSTPLDGRAELRQLQRGGYRTHLGADQAIWGVIQSSRRLFDLRSPGRDIRVAWAQRRGENDIDPIDVGILACQSWPLPDRRF